jgi:hypothetical protein
MKPLIVISLEEKDALELCHGRQQRGARGQ